MVIKFYKYVLCNMLPSIIDNLNTYILYFKKRLQENSFVNTNFNSIQGYSLIKFLEYKVNLLQDPNFIHLVEENYYGINTTENSAS